MAGKKTVKGKQTLSDALGTIQKLYGDGAISVFSDKELDIKRIHSGSMILDDILGGGYPVGRVAEIFGPESSGKTTISLEAVASAQRDDPNRLAVYVDMEHALDPEYAQALGVDLSPERFLLSQPSYGEEGLDILEKLIDTGKVSIGIVDSVSALVPKAELEGEITDHNVAGQARLMSKYLRKINGKAAKNNTIVIFINQIRKKIGVMFGSPDTTSGGEALKFYSSIRLDLRIKEKDDELSLNRVQVKCIKNKTARPYKKGIVSISYGVGLDYSEEIIESALRHNLLKKSGAWYSKKVKGGYKNFAQGHAALKEYLAENEQFFNKLVAAVEKKEYG